jgi:ParB/RepB/Spo0J family partition protein
MSSIVEIEVDKLFIGKCNVRKTETDISELTESVKNAGVIEPLIVRPTPDGRYEVVVGGRRLRAAKEAGLKTVPCIVKELSDDEAIMESLVENIQRGELTEREIVLAYETLHKINPKKWTQEAVAKKVGKSQSWLADMLAAHRTAVKLERAGVIKGWKIHPREEERKIGIAPATHLREIEYALKSPELAKLPESEKEKMRVELAKETLDLPIDEAKLVIEEVKKRPEAPIKEIKEEVLASKKKRPEALPVAVAVKEVEAGEYECPECKARLVIVHYEPDKKHKLKEAKKEEVKTRTKKEREEKAEVVET